MTYRSLNLTLGPLTPCRNPQKKKIQTISAQPMNQKAFDTGLFVYKTNFETLVVCGNCYSVSKCELWPWRFPQNSSHDIARVSSMCKMPNKVPSKWRRELSTLKLPYWWHTFSLTRIFVIWYSASYLTFIIIFIFLVFKCSFWS